MITPAELQNHVENFDKNEQRDIERVIDQKLKELSSFGPGQTFTYCYSSETWKYSNIEAVAERYRAAGWTVDHGAFCLMFTAPNGDA